MKKNLFRWGAGLSVAALALLASCGPQPSKVTVWSWDPNFNGYSMKQAAAVYNKAHPEVTIELVDFPNSDAVAAKIQAGLQAGGAGLPDIALFQDFQIEQFIGSYPGVFADLKAAGIDYSQFAPYKVGPMSVGDKVYGIPFDTGSTGLYLRADYLQKAGLKPEDYQKNLTWKDVIALGKIVKAKIKKPLIAYDNSGWEFLRMIVQSSGGQFFKADGSLDIDSPAVKAGIQVIKDLNDAGVLYQTEGWGNWVSAFNNGDSAGLISAVWIIGTLKSQKDNAGKWMVVPTPLLEGVDGAQNASNWGGSSWYVFDKAKNKAGAIDFLKSVWASKDPAALDFYNNILKGAGAMGTFLPSRDGSNYTAKDDFFYNSQPVYSDFAKWMANVPALRYTANYVAMGSVWTASLSKMFKGQLKTPEAVIADVQTGYKQAVSQ
jgi:lactose/L-arabinose transport system substrate-binding protein